MSLRASAPPPATFYAGTTDASVRGAAAAAAAAGGGVVLIPAATISLSSPLPVYSGVVYQGSGWTLNYNGVPDASSATAGSGTWLIGNGSFAAFSGNGTDGVSPYGTQTAFAQAGLTKCGIKNIGVSNFSYGCKIGSNYNPGSFYSGFERIIALGCGWGWHWENHLHNEYGQIYALNNSLGGVRWRSSATTAILQPSNSKVREALVTVPAGSFTARGIVISCANGTNGGLTQADIIQSNRFGGSTSSQSATTNGTATIAVSDTSKYAIAMPVAFSALGGASGLVLNQIYFITAIVTNTSISIANAPFGSNLTPGAGTPTILTQGMPCLELVADDSNAANHPTLYAVGTLDLEAGGTCKAVFQNLSAGIAANVSAQTAGSTQDICVRNSNVPMQFQPTAAAINFDTSDGASNQVQVLGFPVGPNSIGPTFGLNGNAANKSLWLATNSFGLPTLKSVSPGGYDFTLPGLALGQATSFGAAGSFSLTTQYAGCFASTNASASTWTLPTITASLNGLPQEIPNPGAGTLTLNTAVGQGYNGTTRTALTINSGASVSLRAVWTGSSGFWAVTGIGGTYSAGTISTI